MVFTHRLGFQRFFLGALFCFALVFISCTDSSEKAESEAKKLNNNCQIWIFYGKSSCPACDNSIEQVLASDCFINYIDVKLVSYYKGKVVSPVMRELPGNVDYLGYYDVDFTQLPIDQFSRDSSIKPRLFFIANKELVYQSDFSKAFELNGVIGDCSICKIKQS